MSYLVVMVIDDPENCPAVLDAWEELGVTGITILESSGLGRFRGAGLRDDLPLMPSLQDLFENQQVSHRTIFSVVRDEALVDRMAAAAEKVTGNLDEPHTGFLFVVPVVRVHGFGQRRDE
jgi:nitrogen regulatory protein P-II 1